MYHYSKIVARAYLLMFIGLCAFILFLSGKINQMTQIIVAACIIAAYFIWLKIYKKKNKAFEKQWDELGVARKWFGSLEYNKAIEIYKDKK